jgi:hypothetical protein
MNKYDLSFQWARHNSLKSTRNLLVAAEATSRWGAILRFPGQVTRIKLDHQHRSQSHHVPGMHRLIILYHESQLR